MQSTIAYISPGPTYNAHSPLYQRVFKKLSGNFRGYILTTGSATETFPIGNFTYSSIRAKYSAADSLRFFSFCWESASRIRDKGERIKLVTTYDPLKTGLIGLAVSRMHRARFAPEVNGVYTSPAEWIDNAGSIGTKVKKTLYPQIMRFVLKHADGIKLLYKEQISPFGEVIRGKIVRDFHCLVPVENFRNIREDKEVLFVGFPFKRKGVDILIEAFKKIAPGYPEWKLKILGWFPDPGEMYRAIGGHPQIYHHKPVKHEKIIGHIGSCAILVLPSRSEAMGRVLVESMAAGKPRIGSNVDGIPTVINDGVDGLLVRPEDTDDLAEKLDMLMGDPALRYRLGRAGEVRAEREFSEKVFLDNITSFYQEVLGAGPGKNMQAPGKPGSPPKKNIQEDKDDHREMQAS
ncbi:MAG TPA: glycosyltransferase [Dissulfurispiraceae bacterium]